MALWYVNADYTAFDSLDGSPVVWVDCANVEDLTQVDTADALSDPGDDLLRDILAALLPRGSAWRTPDGQAFVDPDGSPMGRTMAALASGFGDLYRRAFAMTEESRINKVSEVSLADWEIEWGLPDPCVIAAQTVERRLQRLRSKVKSPGTITAPDFVRLAALLGYTIAIRLPSAARAGMSTCGGRDWTSAVALEQQWGVFVFNIEASYFRAGDGEAGVDRLLSFNGTEILECVFRALAPAWTFPVFNYAGWPQLFSLVDESGSVLTDENGNPLTVVTYPPRG